MQFSLIKFIALFFFLSVYLHTVVAVSAEERGVDDLAQSIVGEFPQGWKTYPLQMGKAKKVYKVSKEGDKNFIQADDHQNNDIQIFRKFDWPLESYPYLKFRWRAQKLPQNAVDRGKITDNVCGVYVGYSWNTAIKFVWSASFPAGSYWAKQPGKYYVVSLESGPNYLGQWREASIPVAEEYKKYFGKTLMKDLVGIGLMTNTIDKDQATACDYADFRISSTP